MLDKDTIICICNDLTLSDIAGCIKDNNITGLDELLQNDSCPMGDKCESCIDVGFDNDGLNLPMVLAMVKNKQI